MQVLPHPLINRPIPALHGVVGLKNISILQHVIADQHAAGSKKTHDLRQKMYVLTLGGVHKNQIIGSGKFGEHILRVTENEIYSVAHPRCLKVLPGR